MIPQLAAWPQTSGPSLQSSPAFPDHSLQCSSFFSWGSTARGWIRRCRCHRDKLNLHSGVPALESMGHALSPLARWPHAAGADLLPSSPGPGEPLIKFPLLWNEASSLSGAQQTGKNCPLTHLKHASQSTESSQRHTLHPKWRKPSHYSAEWSAVYYFTFLPSRRQFCIYFCNLRIYYLKIYISQSGFWDWDFIVLLSFHKKPMDVTKIPILWAKEKPQFDLWLTQCHMPSGYQV